MSKIVSLTPQSKCNMNYYTQVDVINYIFLATQ